MGAEGEGEDAALIFDWILWYSAVLGFIMLEIQLEFLERTHLLKGNWDR